MPRRQDYQCLSLADAVRHMAEHHAAMKNRHISRDEYELLVRAAEVIDLTSPKLAAYA